MKLSHGFLVVGLTFGLTAGVAHLDQAAACVPSFEPVTTRPLSELNADCDSGDAKACLRVGRVVSACAFGDLYACNWIRNQDGFRAHELAVSSIIASCYGGDPWACEAMEREDFGPSTTAFAKAGRCLIGIAGACEGFPEPEPPPFADAPPEPPPHNDFKKCRGDATCLARECRGGDPAACAPACAAADPSSCALLEADDFDPSALTRKLQPLCKRGQTAACVSIWALNGAHFCSRRKLPAKRFTTGVAALERACAQGWLHHSCIGPSPDQDREP